MKRILILLLTLAAIALAFACGSQPPTNSNQNANTGAVNVAGPEPLLASSETGCSEINIGDRRDEVEKKLLKKIKDDYPKLYRQIGLQMLKLNVVLGPGVNPTYLDMYVGGMVGGRDEFVDLTKVIRNFLKKDCTEHVYLIPASKMPLTSPAPASVAADGFLWLGCEDPTIPCPNGTCMMSCPTLDPGNGNINANSTPPVAPNSNSNSNGNSNSNAKAGNGKT